MKRFLLLLLLISPAAMRAQGEMYGTDLWLEILSVTNGSAYVVLHNMQPGESYQLMSKGTLTDPAWNPELILRTVANQNYLGAMIPILNRTNALFLRAQATGGGDFVSSYITNGLLEWNKLNDGAGTAAADASGNGNTLPLLGFPAWGDDYLILNGSSQYGDAGSNQLSSLDLHDMSLCAWIMKTGSSLKGIVDKSDNIAGVGYGGWSFRVLENNYLDWWVEENQDLMDAGEAPINLGQWTFVAVVWHYATQTAEFYINGVLNSAVSNGAAAQGASGPADLEVGNMMNNASGGIYAFDGSMRDVGIYNRALSAAEVETNFLGSEISTNVSVPDLLYYEMTEGAQINPPISLADSSTDGGATGTVLSAEAVQWDANVASIPGTALHFDGVSTRIVTGNSTVFDFTTNLFTINLWARPLAAGGCLVANGILQTNGWYLSVGDSYQIVFGTETNGTDAAMETAAGAAQVGEYTMVTVARTGPTNVSIYINGIQAEASGTITEPAPSTNSMVFGVDGSGGEYFNGDIWLPQIWGEALSPVSIANLFFMESLGRPWPVGTNVGGGGFFSVYTADGLVEWNKLNDGSGTNAADASGHGNSLPLLGSPAWGDGYLTFNGSSQYGDAGSNQLSSLDQHDLTICAWLNKSGSSLKGIVDKGFVNDGVGYGGWGLRVLESNRLDWWVEDGQDIIDNGAETVAPGQWTFVGVAWHYAAQKADFYINGLLDSSVANGAAVEAPSGTANLEVGNIHDNESGGGYAFDGSMHDIGIYNRALSATEMASNYLGSEFSVNVSVPDLLYYKMTEHAETNPPVFLADSSTLGLATGTVFSSAPTTLQWVTNVGSLPETALHFNGVSTHIDTSNSVLFNFTTNLFTINLWVRPLTANGYIMENGINDVDGWYLRVGGSYEVEFGTEAGGADTAISTEPGGAQDGIFTMVTVVRTAPTNALIYINGVQTAITGGITIPDSSTNSLLIGVDRPGAHTLDGDLWLPQIWGEALPATSIANLYLMQSSGRPWP